MLKTLRSQMFAGGVAILMAALGVLLWNAQRILEDTLQDNFFSEMEQVKPLLNSAIGPLMAMRDHAALKDVLRQSVSTEGLAYLEVRDHLERLVARHDAPVPGEQLRETWMPVTLAGQVYGSARFAIRTDALARAQQAVWASTAWLGFVALGGGVLLLAVLVRVVTGRLSRVVAASHRIASGDHAARVPEDGPEEVRQLASAFNTMVQSLAQRVIDLADSEARQRTLVDALAEGVVFQDDQGRVAACNDAALRILGATRDTLIGRPSCDPAWPAVNPRGEPIAPEQHPSAVAQRTGEPQRGILMGLDQPEQGRVWISVNAMPLTRPGAARPYATVTSFSDITASVEARAALTRLNAELEDRVSARTAELAAARDTAEAASMAKSEFLSRMSHELRTPLNAILGFAQLMQLRGVGLEPDQAGQLKQIEAAGWHLLQLINEVLDLARIEAGKLSVSLEPFDLHALAHQALQSARAAADTAGVTLHGPAGAPCWAYADRTRTRQILDNLLSNAIKYNRRGGRAEIAVRRCDEGRVVVEVRDTGRGLTPEQLTQLFQPFVRFEVPGQPTQGTGIGLVITQRLVQAMGGQLLVESVPGDGSVFRFDLAQGKAPDLVSSGELPAPGAAVARIQPRRRVLYVEDNPSNVDLFRHVVALRPWVQLEVATDGLQGLEQVQRDPPDLVVIDIDVPRLDGISLCERVKANPVTRDLPLVALSANAMPRDVERGLAAGFATYLTKPIDVGQVLSEIDRWLR